MARKKKEFTEEGIPTIEEITPAEETLIVEEDTTERLEEITSEEGTDTIPEVTEEDETLPAEEEVTETFTEEEISPIVEIASGIPAEETPIKKANADSAKDLLTKVEIKEGQTLYLRKLNPNLPDDKTKWAVEILHGGNKRHEIFRGTLGKASLTFEKYKVKYLRG